jgi:DNA-binding Lrp family transcriptional regulator
MDKLDQSLLKLLMKNSRISSTSLAKKLKVSREVVSYRINRFTKLGIIKKFFAEINTETLGYFGAAFFVVVKSNKYDEFKEFISKAKFVSWVAEWTSTFNFGMTIHGKDINEIDSKFKEIKNKFKEDIVDHKFILHRNNYFFYEKYFGDKQVRKKKRKVSIKKLDDKDKIILKELSNNSRVSSVILANKLRLSGQAVSKRIKSLEKKGIITKYSIFVDITKLNMYQYSIFVDNKDLSDKERLVSYLSVHERVNFIADYIGDPFLEFGIFVKDPYSVREILLEIEKKFTGNNFVNVTLLQKEFVSVGVPDCVFE